MCHLKSLNTCKGVIEFEYLHSLKILSVKVKFWRVLAGNAVVLFNSLGVNCTNKRIKANGRFRLFPILNIWKFLNHTDIHLTICWF
jgi:hypothetical protein